MLVAGFGLFFAGLISNCVGFRSMLVGCIIGLGMLIVVGFVSIPSDVIVVIACTSC